MRFEKFTTKLQEALAEAQSLAVGRDHPFIEPQHLLLALLEQGDGSVPALVAKLNRPACTAAKSKFCPSVAEGIGSAPW